MAQILSVITDYVQRLKPQKQLKLSKRLLLVGMGGLLGLTVLGLAGAAYFLYHYNGRIYPKIEVAGVALGGLTKTEASAVLTQAVAAYGQQWPITFTADTQSLTVPLPPPAATYAVTEAVEEAYAVGRHLSWKGMTELIRTSQKTTPVPLSVTIDEVWLSTTAASMAAQVDIPAIPPRLDIKTGPRGEQYAAAIPGQAGRVMDQPKWIGEIRTSLQSLTRPNTVVTLTNSNPEVTQMQIEAAVAEANNLLTTQLILSLNPEETRAQTWKLQGTDLVKFIQFEGGYSSKLVADYISGVAEAVNRPPKDAKFQFDETSGRVKEFVPAEDGIEVVVPKTVDAMLAALRKLGQKETVEPVRLVVQTKSPAVGLGEVNQWGIKEKLGVGVSTYWHSTAARIHNVELAAGRLNGTLIKPGEEFSFNAAVGEVSAATGYESAYVIRDGRTQLDDGGGLCQDSTTVFRAALEAGLPITMRKGHSYRVGYYEQNAKAGLDATVYAPSTDLRFINDTAASILLQTEVDSPNRTLKVILYGTGDGRKATINDHVVWDFTPAPPDVYQDDPTLPLGTVKQVDFSAGGAKARFTYTVERGGAVIYEKTFVTVYQPWAAVYLRGTKP